MAKTKKIKEEVLHRTTGAKIAFAIAFVIFAVYAASIIYALVWAGLSSLKTNRQFNEDKLGLPPDWLFSNYVKAFKTIEYNKTSYFGMLFNSIWFTFGSVLLSVFMHAVTGYVFAKYKFVGKQAALSFVLFTMVIPIVSSLPATFKMINTLHLTNSPLYLVTALGGFGSNFLIMYAFFQGLDWSYAEAAQMDGAGHFYTFFRIMLPLAAGPLFALSIVGIMQQWNNYEAPILYLDKMPTLASGLYFYREILKYQSNTPVYLAGILISALPILIVVSAFGNKIMTNMTIGGVKG